MSIQTIMLLGLGNNIAHALTSGPSRITSPTRVAADGEVRWHDWTCTLLADSGWGDDPRVSCPRGTVVGTDRPVAVVNDSVRIARETNDTVEWVDAGMWDQVGVTDLGVLAFHRECASRGLMKIRRGCITFVPSKTLSLAEEKAYCIHC